MATIKEVRERIKKLGIELPKGPKEKEKSTKEKSTKEGPTKENIIEGSTIVKKPREKEKEKEVLPREEEIEKEKPKNKPETPKKTNPKRKANNKVIKSETKDPNTLV